MEYNGISTGFLFEIPDPSGENPIIVPNVHASYGPFNSLADARADLTSTFESISNVPRGYTFCVIENNKPQEYWFTKKGDWSSIEKKNISSESNVVSTAIFRTSNGYLQVSYDGGDTWTNLVSLESLRGPAGINGKDGKDGKDGAVGPQGPEGPAGSISTDELIRQVANNFGMQIIRTTYTDDEDEVHYQYQVQYRFFDTWYTATGNIRGLEGGGGGGSTPIIRIVTGDDGNKYWEIDGAIVVDEDNHPVRANGIDGENGADGRDGRDGEDAEAEYTKFKSIAFIRSNSTPATPPNTDGTYEDPVPRASGWSDGIPVADAYNNRQAKLWMTTRWFSKDQAFMETSSYWTAPQPATDTADIDIEYSNAPLDTSLETLGNPTGNPYSVSNPNGWYDASEVSAAFLSQANWQAIRTMKNGVWGAWTIYKIKGENGEPGISPAAMFKTHVYMRSSAKMASTDPQYDAERAKEDRLPSSLWPVGGSYESPIPINVDGEGNLIWHDGIPAGTERIWESVAIVTSDSDVPPTWSEPALVSDNDKWDFEWCDLEELPEGFKKPSRTSPDDENSGRQEGDPWYDDPMGPISSVNPRPQNPNPVWKAERKKASATEYEAGSDWFVYRVKGENGTQGTSIVIKGHLFGVYGPDSMYLEDAKEDYLEHHDEYGKAKYAIFGEPDNWTKIYEFSIVDGAVVATDITSQMDDGYTYMFNGDGYVWDGDNFFNAGRLQGPEGPAGTSQYVHIKYSNDPRVLTDPASASFTGPNNRGEEPGEYIGIRTDTTYDDSTNPADYKWKKWNGEDGWGYEYIFKLTGKDDVDNNGDPTPPLVPTEYSEDKASDFQRNDYVPTGWTDDPQSPHKEMPYCWVAYRQKINGVWTRYIGSASNNAVAALFSMYSSKGRGLSGVTEKYAVWDDPIHGPEIGASVWQDGIPQFDPSAGYIYLWNYEIIFYDDGTSQTTPPACIGYWQEGISIQRIEEFYYASSVNSITGLPGYHSVATNNNNEYGFSPTGGSGWDRDPQTQRLSKEKIYLWNYEVVTFRKGNEELSNEQKYFVSKPVIIAYYLYTDVEYLINIFKKVEGDHDTAYLGGMVGVVDETDTMKAMLNATEYGQDGEHGRLFIASGLDGLHNEQADIDASIKKANFKVYEDGHVAMRSAEIQGYFEQYFRRVHDIRKYISDTGVDSVQVATFDKAKLSNAVLLGWDTLSYTEDGKTVDFSSNYEVTLGTLLDGDKSGRVIFSNQVYVSKNKIVYANTNYGKTYLRGYFITKSGGITGTSFGEGITLCGGWVEAIKVSVLDDNMQRIVPSLTPMDNLYIVTDWGGSVRFDSVRSRFAVNENQAVVADIGIGLTTGANSGDSYVAIPAESTHFRVSEFNRVILIPKEAGEQNPLYIVMPNLQMLSCDADSPVEYKILIPSYHRQLVFKVESPGTNTPDANIGNLPNLTTIELAEFSVAAQPNVVVSNDMTCIKITYLPTRGSGFTSTWMVEQVNLIKNL